jgi:hypothetical protein
LRGSGYSVAIDAKPSPLTIQVEEAFAVIIHMAVMSTALRSGMRAELCHCRSIAAVMAEDDWEIY